jgi:cytochrome c peroxidase
VVAELEQDAAFVKRFEALYPSGVTKENIASAIADFERSLVTVNAPFDRYLMGDLNAISAEAKEGYRLFKDQGCATCHAGKALGGRTFELMGRKGTYFTKVEKRDQGRFNVTGKEEDKHWFKVPTLRNVALTHPYFHDASTNDLAQAVKVMADVETGLPLAEAQVGSIVKFLQTLTGEHDGKPLK